MAAVGLKQSKQQSLEILVFDDTLLIWRCMGHTRVYPGNTVVCESLCGFKHHVVIHVDIGQVESMWRLLAWEGSLSYGSKETVRR